MQLTSEKTLLEAAQAVDSTGNEAQGGRDGASTTITEKKKARAPRLPDSRESKSRQIKTSQHIKSSDRESCEKTEPIEKLLESNLLWRGSDTYSSNTYASHSQHETSGSDGSDYYIKTGYSQLDQQLHRQGWPKGHLIECLQDHAAGPGVNLFMPALRNLQNQVIKSRLSHSRTAKAENQLLPIVLINPPLIPYLAGWQLPDTTPLWLVQPENIKETFWVAEQVLRSNACLATLIWLDRGTRRITGLKKGRKQTNNQTTPYSATQLRKLQLAACNGNGLNIVFRHTKAKEQPSPATLRFTSTLLAGIKSTAPRSSLSISILKQPGGWGGQQCMLPWHSQLQRKPLPIEQWPVHKPQASPHENRYTASGQLGVRSYSHRPS